MEPITLIILLLVGAAILVALEMLLPTHGLLGVAAAAAACGAVVVAFMINRTVGIGLFVAMVLASPVLATLLIKMWESSPVGRRVTLTHTTPAPQHERILPGDVGQTRTALRPMGEAEFGPVAVQVTAHHGGTIPAGTRVRVVDYRDGVARVEVVPQQA